MYEFVDAAHARAATHTRHLELPPWPDLNGNTSADAERWRCWLQRIWSLTPVAEAIEAASPVLTRRVSVLCEGALQQPRQVRRVVVSVVRYLLRMTSRATPFGLFAGVTPVRFAASPRVRWGENHSAVARVDAVWLENTIRRLEQCSELLRRVPVMASNLCFVRGSRLVLPFQQQASDASRRSTGEVSVRYTRAVAAAMREAGAPVLFGDLADKLAADFPRASPGVVDRMLAELVAQRILLTSLRAPMTVTDPLGHLVEQLTLADADSIGAVVMRELREVRGELSQHNAAPADERRSLSASVVRRLTAGSSEVSRSLAVDLRLDCGLILPELVAREAERAASALARLTPYPSGFPGWKDYHRRFLDRYGSGALVPVREIVNPDTGLGFPAGYRDTLNHPPAQGLPDREVHLLALAQRAATEGGGEAVLDDEAISILAGPEIAHAQWTPHAELSFHVHARTAEALDRGEFRLVVASVSRAAGTMSGRFLDLFDDADRHRLVDMHASLPTVDGSALPAQVSCPPLFIRTENVTRSTAVLPSVISLAEHQSGDGLVPLDDLAVGGDDQRLYLVSLSRRRTIEPIVFSAVEFPRAAHPLLRFLCEIPKARVAALAPFSWGAASRLPFLPRVRYGRTVLSPARWRLTSTDLPGRTATWAEWVDEFTASKQRLHFPGSVYLGEDDRRILLNLNESAHLFLLRSHLDSKGHATLTEAPAPEAYGWFDGRAHEIVVPLAATAPRAWPPPRLTASITADREHGRLPGTSEWLFVKLYGHPDRQGDILTSHVPGLVSDCDEIRQWWYLRYHVPEHHIRLCFRLPHPEAYGPALQRIGAWAADLRRLGLLRDMQVDTYRPETGRYGHGATMAAAEDVFAADSIAATAQLTHASATAGTHPYALTAASFVDMAVSFTGSVHSGTRWLLTNVANDPVPAPARHLHDTAVRLADPANEWASLRDAPGGDEITGAWTCRRRALATYRDRLSDTGDADPDTVLASLLHLHHLRMNGSDEDAERLCYRLARSASLSRTARTARRNQ
ncbi:thiopeptide-type bacteriocin biosynthesis domainprotein [Streptomyces sp. MP131-18]|nr:lantibiotic dehydratase [Streptomyces sp. MP131-18]ONK13300.1 thiopeptide-type bacteriocin biosynthesis domainprotein [Streptomyces sp. MP131-18]